MRTDGDSHADWPFVSCKDAHLSSCCIARKLHKSTFVLLIWISDRPITDFLSLKIRLLIPSVFLLQKILEAERKCLFPYTGRLLKGKIFVLYYVNIAELSGFKISFCLMVCKNGSTSSINKGNISHWIIDVRILSLIWTPFHHINPLQIKTELKAKWKANSPEQILKEHKKKKRRGVHWIKEPVNRKHVGNGLQRKLWGEGIPERTFIRPCAVSGYVHFWLGRRVRVRIDPGLLSV